MPSSSTIKPSSGSFQVTPLPPVLPSGLEIYPVPDDVTAILRIVPSLFTFALAEAPLPLPHPSVILTYGGLK